MSPDLEPQLYFRIYAALALGALVLNVSAGSPWSGLCAACGFLALGYVFLFASHHVKLSGYEMAA